MNSGVERAGDAGQDLPTGRGRGPARPPVGGGRPFPAARPAPSARPTASCMPPPNVTGSLHMGHALDNTIQDALVRFQRMRGREALWQPGTDHAGIATQMVVERQLDAPKGRAAARWAARRSSPRSGNGRSSAAARSRASCAGSAPRRLVARALHHGRGPFAGRARGRSSTSTSEGLIYKDKRLVNWDPQLQTAVSDLEVEQTEVQRPSLVLPLSDRGRRRRQITVATTRPETMLGDTAVAVHPDDERYQRPDRPARRPAAGRPPASRSSPTPTPTPRRARVRSRSRRPTTSTTSRSAGATALEVIRDPGRRRPAQRRTRPRPIAASTGSWRASGWSRTSRRRG